MDVPARSGIKKKHSDPRLHNTVTAKDSLCRWQITLLDECRYGAEGMVSVLTPLTGGRGKLDVCVTLNQTIQSLRDHDLTCNRFFLIIRLPPSPSEAILWLIRMAREPGLVAACQNVVLLTSGAPMAVMSAARVIGLPVNAIVQDCLPLVQISRIFALLLNDRRVVFGPEPASPDTILTPRERDLLEGTLAGIPVFILATRLGCGVKNIYSRRKVICRKLRVNSILSLLRCFRPAQQGYPLHGGAL